MEKAKTIINTTTGKLCEGCTPDCPKGLDSNGKLPHCYAGEGGRRKYIKLLNTIAADTDKTATEEDDRVMGEILDNAVKK